MKHVNFLPELVEFLVELSDSGPNTITPDTDLIESAVIDSLSIVQMLVFIEEKLKIEVELQDLGLESVRTARGIDKFFNSYA